MKKGEGVEGGEEVNLLLIPLPTKVNKKDNKKNRNSEDIRN